MGQGGETSKTDYTQGSPSGPPEVKPPFREPPKHLLSPHCVVSFPPGFSLSSFSAFHKPVPCTWNPLLWVRSHPSFRAQLTHRFQEPPSLDLMPLALRTALPSHGACHKAGSTCSGCLSSPWNSGFTRHTYHRCESPLKPTPQLQDLE